ncbi:MAG: hypothetical protein QM571_02910 [Micrococcaceae bacterium]
MVFPLVRRGIDTLPEAGIALVGTGMNFRTKSTGGKALLVVLCDSTGMGSEVTYRLDELARKMNCTVLRLNELVSELVSQRIFTVTYFNEPDMCARFEWFPESVWLPCPPEDAWQGMGVEVQKEGLGCLTSI